MSKILMLRHGITEGNKKKWFYGETDLPLLPEGIEELKRQKEEGLYPDIPEDALFFTTGKGRTAETLITLFGEREFEKIKDLRELNFGVCECKSFDDLKDEPIFQAWAYDETGDVAFPDGESRNQFKERVARGFNYLLERHQAHEEKTNPAMTVIVCHGGVIAEILESAFPGEKESLWDWMPEPGSGYLLEVEDGKIKEPCLLGKVTIY